MSGDQTFAPPVVVAPSPPEPPVAAPSRPWPATVTFLHAPRTDVRGLGRVALHVALAGMPLLAICAQVLGVIDMHSTAALLVLPLAVGLAVATFFFPHAGDRVLLLGWMWGVVACAVYDAFRLDTVYMLGWWGDFIPTMGTWITGDPASRTGGAVVGYLWRYVGDAGGIGITFFVVASVVGLHHRSTRTMVAAAVGFAVFPVWTGLVVTVALSSRGPYTMFPLTPVTVTLSLIGHLIFGLVLGLGFARTRAAHRAWPWTLRRAAETRPAEAVLPAEAAPLVALPLPRAPLDAE